MWLGNQWDFNQLMFLLYFLFRALLTSMTCNIWCARALPVFCFSLTCHDLSKIFGLAKIQSTFVQFFVGGSHCGCGKLPCQIKISGLKSLGYFLLLECTPTPLTVPSNILLAHKHTCGVDEVIKYVRAVAVKYCKGQCCWTRQHCLITFSSTKHTLFDYLSLTRIFLNEVYVLCFSVDLLFPLPSAIIIISDIFLSLFGSCVYKRILIGHNICTDRIIAMSSEG